MGMELINLLLGAVSALGVNGILLFFIRRTTGNIQLFSPTSMI